MATPSNFWVKWGQYGHLKHKSRLYINREHTITYKTQFVLILTQNGLKLIILYSNNFIFFNIY